MLAAVEMHIYDIRYKSKLNVYYFKLKHFSNNVATSFTGVFSTVVEILCYQIDVRRD